MTDEQVIKAIENKIKHTGRDILVDNSGVTIGDVLDLINRQKAEIKRLRSRDEEFLLKNYSFDKYYDEHISKAKVEAIKEFAERLKKKIPDVEPDCCECCGTCKMMDKGDVEMIIDDLVREMTEGRDRRFVIGIVNTEHRLGTAN